MLRYLAIVLGVALGGFVWAGNSQAQIDPFEEFVRLCDSFGAGYYYIPGTATCLNPSTGRTLEDTVDGVVVGETQIARRIGALEDLYEEVIAGVAMANALENPDLTGNERFGIAVNWGQYEGSHAIGFSAAAVLADDFIGSTRAAISGGFAVGETGGVSSRAGFQLTW